MTKTTMKSLLMTAAVSGLMTGAGATASASTVPASNSSGNNVARSSGLASNFGRGLADQHSCKGQNSCKGQGGCSSGDNGCKGKNSCKGKGGCATDGSKMPG
jgi:hypothetical protein